MSSPGMPWLFRNLRLKILALVLAMALLLAVAFSENPLTIRQYSAPIRYADQPPGLVIIQPPSRATITVTGLNSAVKTLNDSNTYVTVDLARIKVGPSQTVLAQPSVLVNGVSVQGGAVPLSFPVQDLKTQPMDIRVNAKGAPGYQVIDDKTYAFCENPAQACQVQVTAPAGYFDGLVAQVTVEGEISNNNTTVPNLPIRFTQHERPLDLAALNTFPRPAVAPGEVKGVQVTATKSSSNKIVTLRPSLNGVGHQACGLGINGVTVTPGNGVAIVSGPQDIVSKSPDVIALPVLDVTGATGSVGSQFTVPLTDPKLSADPGRVTVTVVLQKQFDCTPPTPAPTPTPTPTPSPSGSPR